MSNAFRTVCHRAASEAMPALSDDLQNRRINFPENKKEGWPSKVMTNAEVRAKNALNKILSSGEWAGLLGCTVQHVNALKRGDEKISDENQKRIAKIYAAVSAGMQREVHDARHNVPVGTDWIAEELKLLEKEVRRG